MHVCHSGILLKSRNNRIENNRLAEVLFGTYLFRSDGNYIADNTVRGRRAHDFGDRGNGIHIWNSNYNTLERNSVTDSRDGIYVQNSYHNAIRNSRVHDLRYGLHYMYSDDNDFEGNEFYNDVAGAAIMYSRRIRFRRNMFLHNRGFATAGDVIVNGKSANGGRRDWLSYLPQEIGFPENLTGEELIKFFSRLRNLPPAANRRAPEISQLNGFGGRAVREYAAVTRT